jgi:hypothetical protein
MRRDGMSGEENEKKKRIYMKGGDKSGRWCVRSKRKREKKGKGNSGLLHHPPL